MDIYYLSVAVITVLIVASIILGYQHQKLRVKIIQRAGKVLSDEDVTTIKKKLDDMMGREIRELCALNDEEFLKALGNVLKQ